MAAWINPTVFRDFETAKVNPPTQYETDEPCDGRGKDHDLGDVVVKVGQLYLCEDCFAIVERCDQCGQYRCDCP